MKATELFLTSAEAPREPDLPSVPAAEIQTEMDKSASARLPAILTGLGVIYLLFAAYCYGAYSATLAPSMVRLALITSGCMFGLAMALKKWPLRQPWQPAFCLFVCGLVLINAGLHFFLFTDPYQTCSLMLLIIGSGVLFTSRPWYILAVLATLAGWGCAAWGKDLEWLYFGFGLFASTLLGLILNQAHIVRERQLVKLESELADRRKHLQDFVRRAQDAEERARRIATAAMEGILIHNSGKILDANATALEMFGYTLEEMRELDVLGLLSSESRERGAEQFRYGTAVASWMTGQRKNKTEFPIEVLNKTILGPEGELQIIAVRDISAQRAEQKALMGEKKELDNLFRRQTALARMDGLLDKSNDVQPMLDQVVQTAAEYLPASAGACLLLWKPDQGLLQVAASHPKQSAVVVGTNLAVASSKACSYIIESKESLVISSLKEDLMGIHNVFPNLEVSSCVGIPLQSHGQLIGILFALDNTSRQYRPEDLEFLETLANRASNVIGKWRLVKQLKVANRHLLAQQRLLQQSVEELEVAKTGVEEANRNLRFKQEELQETIDELSSARVQAEAAERAKTDFLSTISHELRTPLNGVIGMAEMLRSSPLSDEQRQSAAMLCESAARLRRLIEHMLTYADARESRLAMKLETIDPIAMIRELAAEYEPRAREKGLELTCLLPESIPGKLMGDQRILHDALRQIVDNAVKFTDQGQIALQLSEETSAANTVRLRFLVRDTGVGISEDIQAAIFAAFAHTNKTPSSCHEGAGLGLALARQLVELMGGTIAFESVPGQGSAFWFDLPMKHERRSESPMSSPSPAPSAPDEKTASAGVSRVLLVDQESSHREELEETLRSMNLRPLSLKSNYEVLPVLRREMVLYDPFQAVILDASISEDETYLLAETIHADHDLGSLPLLIMLRPDQVPNREQLRQAGIRGWITKPAASDKVKECLAALN